MCIILWKGNLIFNFTEEQRNVVYFNLRESDYVILLKVNIMCTFSKGRRGVYFIKGKRGVYFVYLIKTCCVFLVKTN